MDWAITITKADNGYVLSYQEDMEEGKYPVTKRIAVEDPEDGDETITTKKMLWEIMEYFNLFGSRYDKKRVVINFEKGDKHEE